MGKHTHERQNTPQGPPGALLLVWYVFQNIPRLNIQKPTQRIDCPCVNVSPFMDFFPGGLSNIAGLPDRVGCNAFFSKQIQHLFIANHEELFPLLGGVL